MLSGRLHRFLADAGVSFGGEYVVTWVGERFLLDLRARIFVHVHA